MTNALTVQGIGAANGIAIGPAVPLVVTAVVVPAFDDPESAFRSAVQDVVATLTSLGAEARDAERDEAASVLEAQALMAEDPMWVDGVIDRLPDDDLGTAIDTVSGEVIAMFEALDDEYLAARAADVAEIADRVRRHLAGVPRASLAEIAEPSVVIAETLTAVDTAQLDPERVLGFATEGGGPTSHVAIIARSLGVPAVVGATGALAAIAAGDQIILDGVTGALTVRPDDATLAAADDLRRSRAAEVEAAQRWRGQPVSYGDQAVGVAANVGNQADLDRAIAEESDGIGLLRTEFLFQDREEPPSEDEQAAFYRAALEAFDHPVVIRTFDIGGDKPARFMDVPAEENPFLGMRGSRLYRHHPELFETQIRALAEAAGAGDLWVMLPMISTVEEIDDLTGWIREIAGDALPTLGVMVEVPSVALIADAVAERVDFLSIGSNDLTQYTLAADRTSGDLGGLQDSLHPAVLALCRLAATAGKNHDISVSVCGLAAADPLGAAAFAGMGIGKLSVDPSMVNVIKDAVGRLDDTVGQAVVDRALAAGSAGAAREVLTHWGRS